MHLACILLYVIGLAVCDSTLDENHVAMFVRARGLLGVHGQQQVDFCVQIQLADSISPIVALIYHLVVCVFICPIVVPGQQESHLRRK